jgi:competence protein ComEC
MFDSIFGILANFSSWFWPLRWPESAYVIGGILLICLLLGAIKSIKNKFNGDDDDDEYQAASTTSSVKICSVCGYIISDPSQPGVSCGNKYVPPTAYPQQSYQKNKAKYKTGKKKPRSVLVYILLLLILCGVGYPFYKEYLTSAGGQTTTLFDELKSKATGLLPTFGSTQSSARSTPADAAKLSERPTSTPATSTTHISRHLVVYYLDVGQGDAMFIQLPNGENMLLDGGEADQAEDIHKFLQDRDILKIDYLVATHPHTDHIGSLPNVIDNTDIGAIYMPRVSHTTQAFERLLTSIENKGLKVNTARAGVNILNIEGLTVDIIAPVRDDYKELNDHSAVIMIKFKGTNFLFMGDAEALSEGHITADVDALVLKVGHHGSKTSTSESFLKRVNPFFAIISVGEGNSYGHPDDAVLSRLDDADVNVYRTDEDGTIILVSDGENITVHTFGSEQTGSVKQAYEPGASKTTQDETVMVWLSATGARYHRINNCGRMNPNTARQVTLEKAKESYEPCGVCNPPR